MDWTEIFTLLQNVFNFSRFEKKIYAIKDEIRQLPSSIKRTKECIAETFVVVGDEIVKKRC